MGFIEGLYGVKYIEKIEGEEVFRPVFPRTTFYKYDPKKHKDKVDRYLKRNALINNVCLAFIALFILGTQFADEYSEELLMIIIAVSLAMFGVQIWEAKKVTKDMQLHSKIRYREMVAENIRNAHIIVPSILLFSLTVLFLISFAALWFEAELLANTAGAVGMIVTGGLIYLVIRTRWGK